MRCHQVTFFTTLSIFAHAPSNCFARDFVNAQAVHPYRRTVSTVKISNLQTIRRLRFLNCIKFMKCKPRLSYSNVCIFRATVDPRSRIKEVVSIL